MGVGIAGPSELPFSILYPRCVSSSDIARKAAKTQRIGFLKFQPRISRMGKIISEGSEQSAVFPIPGVRTPPQALERSDIARKGARRLGFVKFKPRMSRMSRMGREARTRMGNGVGIAGGSIVAISMLRVAYDIFVKCRFTWRVVPSTALDVTFLVSFFRRSPWAWIALPFWGTVFLIESPLQMAWASHYPLRVVLFVGCFGLAVGAALIIWGFAIRRRYYSYIGYERNAGI
jgi:hypothetical protein